MDLVAFDAYQLILRRLEHVCDDHGQVFRSHRVLLVSQLDDPLEHEIAVLRQQLDAERVQVLIERRLTGHLSEGVAAPAPEATRKQSVSVEVGLRIPIRMDARRLRKHVAPDDRGVVRDGFARKRGDQLAHGR